MKIRTIIIVISIASVMAAAVIFWVSQYGYKGELIAFGDSITAGTKNYGPRSFGYRRVLQDELGIFTYKFRGERKSGYGWPYQRKHSGVDGEPNRKIIKRLTENLGYLKNLDSERHPVILIHAGSNDMAGDQIKTAGEIDESVAVLSEMISRIRQFSPRIDTYVALLIPSTREPLNTNIVAYNKKVTRMVELQQTFYPNLVLVDMNAAFENDTFGLCAGNWKKNCLADDVHPNEAGYAVMGKQWAACIKNPTAVNCNKH